jgi:uncharacterized protein
MMIFLKRHPLLGFYILVISLSCFLVFIPYRFIDSNFITQLIRLILSPSIVALLIIHITKGTSAVNKLIEKVLIWQTGVVWYLVALLSAPLLFFITIFSVPGAIDIFQLPEPHLILKYGFFLILNIFTAPLMEELGWRGFALPRLQERFGPLFGTLILGTLGALWHLPLWLSSPEYHGATADLIGISLPFLFLRYTGSYMGAAIIYTWLYNRTNGSIFLPMLFHASINTTFSHFYEAFVPALFPFYPAHLLYSKIGFGLLGLLIIVITRARLGYDHLQNNAQHSVHPTSGILRDL